MVIMLPTPPMTVASALIICPLVPGSALLNDLPTQLPCGLASANAGIAMANIIAAMTYHTVTTIMMRPIRAPSFTLGRDSGKPRQ
jgi:hypothetical protein